MITEESQWDPYAISDDGAEGIAQIMPGQHPEMSNEGADGNWLTFDPEAALDFAARTLAGYVAMYRGDYGLALAAWNSGVKAVGVPGRVLHPSFPSLAETVNFVRDILGNAVSYTIPSPQRRDSEFWQPSTVAELEDAFGITLDELLAANPGLSESDLIPGATIQLPGRTIEFAIDVGDSGTPRYGAAPFPWYSDAEGPIYDEVELRDPQERAAHLDLTNEGAFYTVQPGDALVLIAADFETTVAEILELNEQIEDEDEIDAGMQIIIPWSAGWFIARQTDPKQSADWRGKRAGW